jgi:SagB-type dehydrogenase family enzyme
MNHKTVFSTLFLSAAMFAGGLPFSIHADDNRSIALPQPQLDGGIPLMRALNARKSSREFADKPISQQRLSNLLWAAFGVNRDDKKRTAPSAHNRQEIDIYVAMHNGLFRYDAFNHALLPILERDIRALTGKQDFPAHAAVNLVYVADFSRVKDVPRKEAMEVAAISTGAIVQNVYLYCASEGLATVVRGWIDKKALAKAMGLRDDQYIFVAQTVGYSP